MQEKSLDESKDKKIRATLQADPDLLKFYEEELDLERISGIISEGDDLPPEAIRDIIKFVKKAEDGELSK